MVTKYSEKLIVQDAQQAVFFSLSQAISLTGAEKKSFLRGEFFRNKGVEILW